MDIYPYSVLRIEPDRLRGECVNVGLVVWLQHGLLVKLASSLFKLRVLDPHYDSAQMEQTVALLKDMDAMMLDEAPGATPELRQEALQRMGICLLSEPGYVTLAEGDTLDKELNFLMQQLVDAPLAPRRSGQRFSRLETQLRKDFHRMGLLANDRQGIHDHRIVQRYPIIEDERLVADFAYQNGALHVVAAIDFRAKPETVRHDKFKQTAVKSLMLDRACKVRHATPLAVIAVDDRTLEEAEPSIRLLGGYTDKLFNIINVDESERFFEYFRTLDRQQAESADFGY